MPKGYRHHQRPQQLADAMEHNETYIVKVAEQCGIQLWGCSRYRVVLSDMLWLARLASWLRRKGKVLDIVVGTTVSCSLWLLSSALEGEDIAITVLLRDS